MGLIVELAVLWEYVETEGNAVTDKHGKVTRDMTSERTKALIRTDRGR